MISRSVARVAAGGVLASVSSSPPVTIRRVVADDPQVCALCLVGSAAGPLGGDEIGLELTVEADARAHVSATGAALAQGRPGGRTATLRTVVAVGERAVLWAEPPPLIAAAGSSIRVDVDLDVAESATVAWRELLVLGRSGEPPGAVRLSWSARRAGQPLLTQTVDLGDPVLAGWPGMLAGRRVMASAFVTGPQLSARTVVYSDTAVCQLIDERTVLITVLGREVPEVDEQLADLIGETGETPGAPVRVA